MKNALLIYLLLCSSFLNAQDGKVISENGNFISVSPNEEYILFGRPQENFLSGDYIEGHVFLYDIKQDTELLLTKDTLELSAVIFRWDQNNNLLYSNGKSIFMVSAHKVEANLIYKVSTKHSRITDFSLSPDGKYLSLWMNIYVEESGKYFYELHVLNLKENIDITVYTLENEYYMESIPVYTKWDHLNNLYALDVSGNAVKIDVKNGTWVVLDQKIESGFFELINTNLFYEKDNQLIMQPVDGGNQESILSEDTDLEITSISDIGNNSYYIGINDNLVYCDLQDHEFRIISVGEKGKFVYTSKNIFVMENTNRKTKKTKLTLFKTTN